MLGRRLGEVGEAVERACALVEVGELVVWERPVRRRNEVDGGRLAVAEADPFDPLLHEALLSERVRERAGGAGPHEQVEVPPPRRQRPEHEDALAGGVVDQRRGAHATALPAIRAHAFATDASTGAGSRAAKTAWAVRRRGSNPSSASRRRPSRKATASARRSSSSTR